jgi:hypothetical protein
MSHDPCVHCGEQTGPGSENDEILVDGDAPPITVCSYKCLVEWAEDRSEERYLCTDSQCGEIYWESEIDTDQSVRVCPHCSRYEKQYRI